MFDSYNIPMDKIEAKICYTPISDKDIELYAKNIEIAFGLPVNTLKNKSKCKTGVRPKKKFGLVNLSEIRKAAIFRLLEEKDVPYLAIAHHFGIKDHTSIVAIKKKARIHLETDDQKFFHHYKMVKNIAI
jgi:chromosomal replication initiation ATPase DnaA